MYFLKFSSLKLCVIIVNKDFTLPSISSVVNETKRMQERAFEFFKLLEDIEDFPVCCHTLFSIIVGLKMCI